VSLSTVRWASGYADFWFGEREGGRLYLYCVRAQERGRKAHPVSFVASDRAAVVGIEARQNPRREGV
jgi:hypothetical protein